MARPAHSMTMLGLKPLRTHVLNSSVGLRLMKATSSSLASWALHTGQTVHLWFSWPTRPDRWTQSRQKMWLNCERVVSTDYHSFEGFIIEPTCRSSQVLDRWAPFCTWGYYRGVDSPFGIEVSHLCLADFSSGYGWIWIENRKTAAIASEQPEG